MRTTLQSHGIGDDVESRYVPVTASRQSIAALLTPGERDRIVVFQGPRGGARLRVTINALGGWRAGRVWVQKPHTLAIVWYGDDAERALEVIGAELAR